MKTLLKVKNYIVINLDFILTVVEFFLEVAIWYLIPNALYK